MKKEQIVINTIVFREDIEKGKSQVDLLKSIKDYGVKNIEIRREYLKNLDKELTMIRDFAKEYNIKLFYSVPEMLFVNGKLNKDGIKKYNEEAEKLGASLMKLVIGQFEHIGEDDTEFLSKILIDKEKIFTVENDQTEMCGKVDVIEKFLDQCLINNLPIYFTFDIGNWFWVKEDPVKNSDILRKYVKYIHIKDVKFENGIPKAVHLGNGIVNFLEVLKHLPDNVPVAIEYPCGTNPFKLIDEALSVLVNE